MSIQPSFRSYSSQRTKSSDPANKLEQLIMQVDAKINESNVPKGDLGTVPYSKIMF
jgi:hypothetical protein